MKVRHDFVTNSSSTSYCIVGISDESLVEEILNADAKVTLNILRVVHDEYDNAMVGFDAEEILQDKSIAQATHELVELLRRTLDVHVTVDDIKLLFGGYYNG